MPKHCVYPSHSTSKIYCTCHTWPRLVGTKHWLRTCSCVSITPDMHPRIDVSCGLPAPAMKAPRPTCICNKVDSTIPCCPALQFDSTRGWQPPLVHLNQLLHAYPFDRLSELCTTAKHILFLCFFQGRCISYQPNWQPFPLLEVRADVVVVGPDPVMACTKLARLVAQDMEDMSAQGHYVQALLLQVSPALEKRCPQPLWLQ